MIPRCSRSREDVCDVEQDLLRRFESEVELFDDRLRGSLTSAGGFASAATGMRPTSRGASQESVAMSS